MIENNILEIRWPNGGARIYLEEFFPTSGRRCRQLFRRLILLDPEWPQITEGLIRYLDGKLQELPGDDYLKGYANSYADCEAEFKKYDRMLRGNATKLDQLRAQIKETKDKALRAKLRDLRQESLDFSKTLRDKKSAAKSSMIYSKGAFYELLQRRKLYKDDIAVAHEFLGR